MRGWLLACLKVIRTCLGPTGLITTVLILELKCNLHPFADWGMNGRSSEGSRLQVLKPAAGPCITSSSGGCWAPVRASSITFVSGDLGNNPARGHYLHFVTRTESWRGYVTDFVTSTVTNQGEVQIGPDFTQALPQGCLDNSSGQCSLIIFKFSCYKCLVCVLRKSLYKPRSLSDKKCTNISIKSRIYGMTDKT